MPTSRDDVVRRIELMLRRCDAKAGATQAEVEAALAAAEHLMKKYEIEMAEVMAEGQETLGIDSITEAVVRQHSKTDKHELAILRAVCAICSVKAYTTTKYVGIECPQCKGAKEIKVKGKVSECPRCHGSGDVAPYKPKKRMVIYGHQDDVAMAHAMFRELIVAVRAFARFNVPGKWTQKHYWYCNGFGEGLCDKAYEIQTKREQEKAKRAASTTALIVRKEELIEEYAKEKLHLRAARRTGRGSYACYASAEYAQGEKDGQQYDHTDKVSDGRDTPKLT